MSLDQLNASELQAVGGTLGNLDANNMGNRADVEFQWAMKAYHHAETYDNIFLVFSRKSGSKSSAADLMQTLLKSVDPQFLKLTRMDDELYDTFRKMFPKTKVDVLDIEELKSASGKEKWRQFCNLFEHKVENFNMGTLMRIDCSQEFSEHNSTLVVRVQFLALEIARNREGHNNAFKQTLKQKETESPS